MAFTVSNSQFQVTQFHIILPKKFLKKDLIKDGYTYTIYVYTSLQLKESEEKVMVLSKEREVLLKQRDSTFQETQLWRSELVKAKEHTILLEAAANKAEERARIAEADSEAKSKDAENNAVVAAREKDELKSISEFSAITTSKVIRSFIKLNL